MKSERKRLLTKIAYLYYYKDKTQSQISKELGINRSSISRYLKRARDEDIVKIHIDGLESEKILLEDFVKSHYNLNNIEIVSVNSSDSEKTKNNKISKRAGEFIKQLIRPNMIVGLSWGASISNTIKTIETQMNTECTFIPIVGGPTQVNSHYHVNTLVYEMALKFGGQSLFMNAAVVQENKDITQRIYKTNYVEEITNYWDKLDLVIVGIGGTLDSKESQWRYLLGDKCLEELKFFDAIGDCCCRFFNKDGRVIKSDVYDNTIAIDLDRISKVPKSIGIARGKEKAKAILAIIRANILNNIVTDCETIEEVLKLDGIDNWKNEIYKIKTNE